MSRQARNHLLDLLLALLLVCTAKCKLPADEAERVARVLEEPVWSGLQNILVPSPEASETLAIHNVALTSPVFDGSAQEVPVYGPARSRYNGIQQSNTYLDQPNIQWTDESEETGGSFPLVENQVLPNGQYPGPTRVSQGPRHSPALVWNEQGQYWGYAPQNQPNNNARRSMGAGGGTSVVEDGTCLPPFCVPAICSDPVRCASPCVTRNCDFGCFSPCISGKDCVTSVCRCTALRRGSVCHLLRASVCQQHFHLTCLIGCFLPVSLRLPPECDCVFPPQALFTPSCALPSHLTCPDNCSGKGHCDIATGKCTCKPGFTGENCATADPCSPESGLTPCQFKCVAVNATRVCICPSPFILQPDGVSCGLACPTGLTGTDCRTDIDECLTGSHNCQQDCINTFGSYRCSCRENFIPDVNDKTKCIPAECNPKCVAGQGNCGSNRTCECKKGFHGISCEKDINKCQETGQNNCHHRCINTFGSFRCECDPGYNLNPRDNRTCIRDKCIDTCVQGQGECQNGRCVCRRGFSGRDCELDMDECREQPNICDQRCVNSFGSFRCECDPGYNLDPRDNRTCVRDTCFDTCVQGQGECCKGICQCRPGFTGINCELDIDECQLGTHKCDQICINTRGAYRCECQPGYEFSTSRAERCEHVDCHSHCVPGHGECNDSGECQCRPGYEGVWCDLEVDLCASGRHNCEHICVSSQGTFFCRCHEGFRPDPQNPSRCMPLGCPKECVPGQGICEPKTGQCKCKPGFQGDLCDLNVDECSLNNGGCSHKCVDTFGSFHCECPPGWRLAPNSTRICELVGACNPPCVPGQGTCVDTGCCKCKDGYMGMSCEIIYNACKALKPCQQRCINLGGGNYECSCWKGFVPAVHGNASKCIRSCVPGENCIHGECVANRGRAPFCWCKPGFRGSQCDEDVNECLEGEKGRGLCQQQCTNTFGSFRCSCGPGYRLQSDGVSCLKESESEFDDGVRPGEWDACKEKQPCEQLCFNTRDGEYQCACTEGFELNADGSTCSSTKLCSPPCADGARCLQGRCLCPPGYGGPRCDADIDECSLPASVHGCSFGCVNLPGSYKCICPAGYLLLVDNKTCIKPSHDADCQVSCQNGGICIGRNICRCLRGFTGKDCSLDIDECQRYRPCDPDYGLCINRYGGFDCECKPGYVLLVDGRHCIEEARARQAPHLIYRGKGTKGVVVGGPARSVDNRPRRHLGTR